MHIKVDKFMYNMRDEINAHGIYMATRIFPWCDTFELYSKSPNLSDYESSFPYYHDHRDEIHNHLNGLAKDIGWKETLDTFVYVKGTQKGIHIPSKSPTIIFSLDSDLRVMTCKELPTLVMSLAIYDYALYNYKDRKITPTMIRKGSGKLVGNIWGHCIHIKKGQEMFYATYS